jgi:alpha-glucosidase
MPAGWGAYAVDAQAASPTSTLAHFRRALAARRTIASRLPAQIDWLPAPPGVLAYRRGDLTVACNFRDRAAHVPAEGRIVVGSATRTAVRNGVLTLPANSAAWVA